jgi:hypothetical protein
VPGLVELEGAVPQAVPHRRARQLVFEGGYCSIKPEAIPSAPCAEVEPTILRFKIESAGWSRAQCTSTL